MIPQILALDSGWVVAGYPEYKGLKITVHNALVIIRWGTSGGLGELAKKGPLQNTKLGEQATIQAPASRLIFAMDVDAVIWEKVLGPCEAEVEATT